MNKSSHKVIGLMSGSSLDGVDVVSCTFNYDSKQLIAWSLDKSDFYKLDEELASQIRNYASLDPIALNALNQTLGEFYGRCILKHSGEFIETYDAVGVHGQTIYHLPELKLTCQLGCGSTIQARIDIPVVSDFRMKDLLAGGEGTPMAPLADDKLFPGYDYYINLGGIANVSYVNTNGDWIAFDVCPFNQVSNHFASKLNKDYDTDGNIGAQGQVQTALVKLMRSYPFFKKEPPKSLDNNWIMNTFVKDIEELGYSVEDTLSSFYEFTVESICESVQIETSSTNKRLFVSGGGTYNTFFIKKLQERLMQINVELIVPAKDIIDYKEAALIALAASYRLMGKPNFYSSVTGASTSVCGGVLYT